MKMKAILILLVCGLTACGSVFTKADAAHIGGGLALASLNLAARVVGGETLNLKVEAAKLGLDVASQATAIIVGNLGKPDATPASVVVSAELAAKEVIQSSIVESPKVAALAESIAGQAADAALKTVQRPN